MATFVYDHEPGDEVYVVVESGPEFIIEKSRVKQVEFISDIDEDESIEFTYTYLVLNLNDRKTRRVLPPLVFATEVAAINYIKTELSS